jgi:outer membrane protein OmpA-like peptidoglycan-associated protein
MFSAAILMFVGTGCATKKHVRGVVAPVESRVSAAEKRATEQQAAIGELETGVSRADERAMDAERKATAAGQSADKANSAATTAHNRADQANQLAESTRNRLSELSSTLSSNIDNYQLVTTEKVLFGLNRHQLTDEAKSQLDEAVSKIQGTTNYVLEIQGFTDATGSAASNLELSRRRADSVVRYLTAQHNIPLRKINVLGLGEELKDADNKTREGRKEARRVDIKVFALDLGLEQANTGTGTERSRNSSVSNQ